MKTMDSHMRVIVIVVAALGGCLVSHSWAQQDLDRCYRCKGVCETENVCRCDDQCEIYGDCCGYAEERPPCNETLPPFATAEALPTFQCHSVFVEESQISGEGVEKAFWMVESCPTGWAGSSLEMDCRNNTMFYPVTDTTTGLVYSNEHCAACNSAIATDLVRWRTSLVCSDALIELTKQPSFTLTLEVLKAYCHPCSYVEPTTAVKPRPCYHHVASCLSKDELELHSLQQFTDEQYDELVKNCTKGPYSLVREHYLKSDTFRNQYCAACNGLTDHLACVEYGINELTECTYHGDIPLLPSPTPPANETTPEPIYMYGSGGVPPVQYIYVDDEEDDGSFSLVLDILGDGLVVAESETITLLIAVICSVGEVFDPVLNDCRQTVCPEGFILNEGICQFDPGIIIFLECPGRLVALNSSDVEVIDNNTLLLNGTQYVVLYRDPENSTIVCLLVLPSCTLYIALTEEDDYDYINNDTVAFNGEEHRIAYVDTLGQPVICSPFSMNGTQRVNVTIVTYSYPAGFVELTYIGCSFSVVGCALILLTYSLFKELRTVPSKILMNLSVTILVSNLFILLSGLGRDSQDFCVATAIILHLFFLAQFSWMSIMTFEMGRTFNHARKLAHESSKAYKAKLLLVYSLVGWTAPLIIVSATVAVNFTTNDLVLYGETEDGDEGSCWINHLESALIAFVAPVVLSILFNLTVFSCVSVWIYKSWRTQAKLNKDQNIPYIRIYFAVMSATGLTWVFGFLAILAGTSWSWYPFIVLNSFQGFLIFLGFLATKKILKLYLSLLTCGKVREVFAPSKHSTTGLGSKKSTELQSRNYATKSSSDLRSECNNHLECAEPV